MTGPLSGDVRAPDLVETVIGFRQWRIHDGALWSAYSEDPWRRGVNVARCHVDGASHAEGAPGHDCSCGIHAWYRPCPPLASPATSTLVAGAVALWGEIELHSSGMRAQYGMVVALVRPVLCRAKRREVIRMAAALEVEAVPARRLEAVALHHGSPVPQALRPRPPVWSPAAEALAQGRDVPGPVWHPTSLVSGWQGHDPAR
jgi:hypothetical protein